jgi:hypothetical protein
VARARVSISVDAALRLRYARLQDEAMAAQFATPDEVDPAEWESWRAIRDEAVRRALGEVLSES